MTFSERMGLKQRIIQADSMDDDLRNSIWNCLYPFFQRLNSKSITVNNGRVMKTLFELVAEALWLDLLKMPTDEREEKFDKRVKQLKNYFMACEWFEAYDFLEFVVNHLASQKSGAWYPEFISSCNGVLARERSAYRITDKKIAPVTTETEIAAIEDALAATDTSTKLALVNTHLNQALAHLSDRHTPVYRNSMKESISAVECLCKLIANRSDATLSPALDAIQKTGARLHPALVDAFKKLYSYTSDADGIRHALKDEPTVDVEDARYMLVICAGFVSYLTEKARKAGVAL